MAKVAEARSGLIVAVLWVLSAIVAPVLIALCLVPSTGGELITLQEVGYENLAGWDMDQHGEAISTLRKSCNVVLRRDPNKKLGSSGVGGYIRDWVKPCLALENLDANDHLTARAFFESWFVPFLVSSEGRKTGLFTGYYEPTLEGSYSPSAEFSVPIYAKPENLVSVNLGEFADKLAGERISGHIVDGKLRPFSSRGDIELGALAGKGLELLWVNDPIAAFFLHIQGSGRVIMPDGESIRLGYDGQNGHPYRSIGSELVERGFLVRKDVTMQSIRGWLKKNPEHRTHILNQNKSYIFFRELQGEGPIGAQNVVLTPERSLAVDLRHIPLGVPVWLDIQVPQLGGGDKEWHRLMVTQDTGGAIRGVVRGDVFWGAEARAAEIAGRMKHYGHYYLLLPLGLRREASH